MSEQNLPTIVVTGVSSGIGEAIALHLIQAGYCVYGSVRKAADAERLKETLGEYFIPMLFDVRDRDAINVCAQQLAEALDGKPLVALVNNAGLAAFGPMQCLDDTVFEDTITVNLFGTRNVTNAFLPMLINSAGGVDGNAPGKIINISSLSGILNTPMNGAYCVSKHAMESLSEIYRRELLSDGIKVVSIRSGPIQSQIWEKNAQQDAPQFENPNYQRMSENATAIMDHAARSALPAVEVAKLILDIVENRKRALAYEMGRGATVSKVLSSWVPTRLADWLINRALMKSKQSA